MSERFELVVDGQGATLPTVVYAPLEPIGATLLLGHGARAGQHSPFLVDYATGLAERGVLVATYDFPFMSRGESNPDPREVLETCCRTAIVAARKLRPENALFLGGRSLGGRVASDVAAAGGAELDDVTGLVVLGYPLHPIGRREVSQLRALRDLRVPALFVQGTRDVFGTPDELRCVLASLPKGSAIHPVEGGDHSFCVPTRGRVTQAEVDAAIQERIARWIAEIAATSAVATRGRSARLTRVQDMHDAPSLDSARSHLP